MMNDELLREMRRAVVEDLAAEAETVGTSGKAPLGKLAVEMELITPGQLQTCLAEQKQVAKKGKAPTLGQILLRNRLLSAGDLIKILSRQNYIRGVPYETIGGRYMLLGELGRGGGGTVYRALHRDLDKEIALKVLVARPDLSSTLSSRPWFLMMQESSRFIPTPTAIPANYLRGQCWRLEQGLRGRRSRLNS